MEALIFRFSGRNMEVHPFLFDNKEVVLLADRERRREPCVRKHLNLWALHPKIQNLTIKGQV
jgi:hypothetical protein